jgi:hypothetical protein
MKNKIMIKIVVLYTTIVREVNYRIKKKKKKKKKKKLKKLY